MTTRLLAGLGAGCVTGAITFLMDQTGPWWLVVGGCTAVLVWTGRAALEVLGDLIDALF